MTKTEKLINHLISIGCIEVDSKTRKYRKFTIPDINDKFYFVGRNASLRKGRISSNSVSLTNYSFYKSIFELKEK